ADALLLSAVEPPLDACLVLLAIGLGARPAGDGIARGCERDRLRDLIVSHEDPQERLILAAERLEAGCLYVVIYHFGGKCPPCVVKFAGLAVGAERIRYAIFYERVPACC